jgi:hypothetical protein
VLPNSLSHLTPGYRLLIRCHVWLIGMWSIGISVGCHFLLRLTPLAGAPLIMHLLNATALYFAGLLPSILIYLRLMRCGVFPFA